MGYYSVLGLLVLLYITMLYNLHKGDTDNFEFEEDKYIKKKIQPQNF